MAHTLIPSIYSYCDRRCECCHLRHRCLVYREECSRLRTSIVRTEDEPANEGGTPDTNDLGHAATALQALALECFNDLDAATREAIERDEHRMAAVASADPLVLAAGRYLTTTWPIVRTLGPILAARHDTAAVRAVNAIDELGGCLSAKVGRAVLGALTPEFDPSDPQDDVYGSAKVARLIIADSLAAWRVLMEAGRAAANGAPARLVMMLEDLDRALEARYPQAMAFVRPGFDTIGIDGPSPPDLSAV